jgi:hypothetical protein
MHVGDFSGKINLNNVVNPTITPQTRDGFKDMFDGFCHPCMVRLGMVYDWVYHIIVSG